MPVFDAYAAYYDLLYEDKDYSAETGYVTRLLGAPAAGSTLLDIGCGTGLHAAAFAAQGLRVTGLDLSDRMIARARSRVAGLQPTPQFVCGDARSAALGRRFDNVVSLFHVASYQTGNDDIASFLQSAARHLAPQGRFVFDFWYGPAVLAQRPSVRVKRFRTAQIAATRMAEPVMHTDRNVVDVRYEVLVENLADSQWQRIDEVHHMRYFFAPELHLLLAHAGLAIERMEGWLGAALGEDSWAGVVVAKHAQG